MNERRRGQRKDFPFLNGSCFLLSTVTCLHLGKIPCTELFLKLPLTALKRNSKKTPQGTAAGLTGRTVSSLVNILLPKGRRREEEGESFKIQTLFPLFLPFEVRGRGRKEQLWQHSFVIFLLLLRLLLAGWLVFSGCAGL